MAGERGTGSDRPVKEQLLGKVIQLKREKPGPRLRRGNKLGQGIVMRVAAKGILAENVVLLGRG